MQGTKMKGLCKNSYQIESKSITQKSTQLEEDDSFPLSLLLSMGASGSMSRFGRLPPYAVCVI